MKSRHFRFWHKTDMPMQSPHVCCWGMNGPGWDAARSLKMTTDAFKRRGALNLQIAAWPPQGHDTVTLLAT